MEFPIRHTGALIPYSPATFFIFQLSNYVSYSSDHLFFNNSIFDNEGCGFPCKDGWKTNLILVETWESHFWLWESLLTIEMVIMTSASIDTASKIIANFEDNNFYNGAPFLISLTLYTPWCSNFLNFAWSLIYKVLLIWYGGQQKKDPYKKCAFV